MLDTAAASYFNVWLWRRTSADKEAARAANAAVATLRPAVVVTGGSRGIGLALARRFLEARCAVAIVARGAPELEDAARSLESSSGANVVTILCDIGEPNAAEIIEAGLIAAGLYLDVLVNNAGTGLAGPFVSHTESEIAKLLGLNIEALTRLTRAALPAMLARRRGGILNVASLGALVPGPNQALYYASKSFVLSLTEAIASETWGQGVRVAALLPGPIDTSFHERMGAERSLYRILLPPLSPERVARSAYLRFQLGQQVIVPGIFNMLMFIVLRFLPHVITVPFVYWLLRRPDDLSPS